MNTITVLGEILTVIGPIGVLGLWLYQQTEVEQRSNELRRLTSARGVYQTYQSNNALFNAINEVVGENAKASQQLRVFQVYNYELGLAAIEAVLAEPEKSGVPPAVHAYDSSQDVPTKMEQVQKRLGLLQNKLTEKEASITRSADVAKARYFWTFVFFSFLAIFGGACKVVDKLSAVD